MSFIQSGQVDPGPGYQGGQLGDKVHRFEDDVSRAITIRGFQFIENLALMGQWQALFSNGRSGDITAQPFQFVPQGTFSIAARSHLVTLVGFGRHTGVQGESSHFSDRRGVIGIAFIGRRLQVIGPFFAPLLMTSSSATGLYLFTALIHLLLVL